MQHFRNITVVLVTLLLVQSPGSSPAAGLLRVSTGVGLSQSTDLTQTVVSNDVLVFPGMQINTSNGRASVASLGVDLQIQSFGIFPQSGSVNTSFDADVVFSSAPEITTATIGWSALIQGLVNGNVNDTSFEPFWQLNAQLSMNPNNPVSAQLALTETFEFGSPPIAIDTTITALGQVPTNVPVSIFAVLDFNVGARFGDSLRTNFFDSLSFNPSAFFDIQTPGVTANSVAGDGGWLVNNQLTTVASPVPEPSNMVLLATGALGLYGLRRRRGKRNASTVA